jgi:hypothetical protein
LEALIFSFDLFIPKNNTFDFVSIFENLRSKPPGVAESDHEQLGVRATTQLEQQRRYAHE